MELSEKSPKTGVLRIVATFDPSTAEFSLTGCDENPIVALGVLDYALARIRRSLTQADIERELQNAPRLSLSRRVVS